MVSFQLPLKKKKKKNRQTKKTTVCAEKNPREQTPK